MPEESLYPVSSHYTCPIIPTVWQDQYKNYGKSIRKMITDCLQKDPTRRPTATELLKHPFFKKAKDKKFLQQILLQGGPSIGDKVNKVSVWVQDIMLVSSSLIMLGLHPCSASQHWGYARFTSSIESRWVGMAALQPNSAWPASEFWLLQLTTTFGGRRTLTPTR